MNKALEVELLFAHADFYIVNKPAGIGFHDEVADNGERAIGFFNHCVKYFSEALFPVHRLDKLTSGLLILARNKAAAQWFQQAFSNQQSPQIDKLYIALSTSKPNKKQGRIVGDMSKARNSQWKLLRQKTNPAITRFESHSLATEPSGLRLYIIKPQTGKTHQIRVALKSISAPILGDVLYGGTIADRGYLHATAMNFEYRGEKVALYSMPQFGELFIKLSESIRIKLIQALKLNENNT